MENEHSVIEDDEVLKRKLRAIIRTEAEKPIEEMDVDLIDECLDFLMELEGSEKIIKEQTEAGVNAVLEKLENKKHGKKNFGFKALIAAACLAIILLAGNLAAMAFGIDTVSVYKQLGTALTYMLSGEEVDYSGITIIKENQAVNYDSFDEFISSEDYRNILYPAKLPKGIKITGISIVSSQQKDYYHTHEDIFYTTNNPEISIIAHTEPEFLNFFLSSVENYKEERIGNYNCYTIDFNKSFQCAFIHNDITYVIKSPSYEDAVKIIKNLKENRK